MFNAFRNRSSQIKAKNGFKAALPLCYVTYLLYHITL